MPPTLTKYFIFPIVLFSSLSKAGWKNTYSYNHFHEYTCYDSYEEACTLAPNPYAENGYYYALETSPNGQNCYNWNDSFEPNQWRNYIPIGFCQICKYPYTEYNNQCILACPPQSPGLSQSGDCIAPNAEPRECTDGNPIVISTGEKIQREPADYTENRILPLNFQRNYRSMRAPQTNPLFNLGYKLNGGLRVGTNDLNGWTLHYQPANYDGAARLAASPALGENWLQNSYPFKNTSANQGNLQWQHNFNTRIYISESIITLFVDDANEKRFKREGSIYVSNSGKNRHYFEQSSLPEHWQLRASDGFLRIFNGKGQLIRVELSNSIYQTLTYNDSNLLSSVIHSLGGSIDFQYDDKERIDYVVFPDTSLLKFEYDEISNPIVVRRIINPDTEDEIVLQRQYHYESLEHPYALTGITDENNTRYATWSYDKIGRAVESKHGTKNVDKHTFDYSLENQVTVTNPLNKKTIYHYKKDLQGVSRVYWIEGVASASCAAAHQGYTYDENGYILSKTSWKGVETRFTRDDYGREISRTEAYGTANERTVLTDWHPTLNVITKIREPGRITSFDYNERGQVLSKTIEEPEAQ